MNYDDPIFKRLARNDTSSAPGHQGGIVIPKALSNYFPTLHGNISAQNPTLDMDIEADLFVDGAFKGKVTTRYQCQTWGGTRKAEWRLTSNLGPIRDAAAADDLLVFERSLDDPAHMRLTLLTRAHPDFERLLQKAGQKRWGFLDSQPVSNDEISSAIQEEIAAELSAFNLLSNGIVRTQSRTHRIAREQAFRYRLMELYDNKCVITARSMITENRASGIDGAHIVPLERGGSNDARNGLALAKDIHWAFDRGLIGFDDNRKVILSPFVQSDARNQYLRTFAGAPLDSAKDPRLNAHSDAIRWHRENIFSK